MDHRYRGGMPQQQQQQQQGYAGQPQQQPGGASGYHGGAAGGGGYGMQQQGGYGGHQAQPQQQQPQQQHGGYGHHGSSVAAAPGSLAPSPYGGGGAGSYHGGGAPPPQQQQQPTLQLSEDQQQALILLQQQIQQQQQLHQQHQQQPSSMHAYGGAAAGGAPVAAGAGGGGGAGYRHEPVPSASPYGAAEYATGSSDRYAVPDQRGGGAGAAAAGMYGRPRDPNEAAGHSAYGRPPQHQLQQQQQQAHPGAYGRPPQGAAPQGPPPPQQQQQQQQLGARVSSDPYAMAPREYGMYGRPDPYAAPAAQPPPPVASAPAGYGAPPPRDYGAVSSYGGGAAPGAAAGDYGAPPPAARAAYGRPEPLLPPPLPPSSSSYGRPDEYGAPPGAGGGAPPSAYGRPDYSQHQQPHHHAQQPMHHAQPHQQHQQHHHPSHGHHGGPGSVPHSNAAPLTLGSGRAAARAAAPNDDYRSRRPPSPKNNSFGRPGKGTRDTARARDRARDRANERSAADRDRSDRSSASDSAPAPKQSTSAASSSSSNVSSNNNNNNTNNKKKKEESSRSASPARLPPSASSGAISHFSLIEREREYVSLKRRYSRLYVPKDFTKAVCLWPESCSTPGSLSIDRPVEFRCHVAEVDAPAKGAAATGSSSAAASASVGVQYFAKVMLLTGAPVPFDRKDHTHLCHKLKFLIEKKDRSELMCIGGEWDATLDGADPVHTPQTLINTAIRTTRASTGLDLSPCKQWIRFMELHYSRHDKSPAVTVIFVPSAWEAVSCVPHAAETAAPSSGAATADDTKQQPSSESADADATTASSEANAATTSADTTQSQQAEAKAAASAAVPDGTLVVVTPKPKEQKLKAMVISLDGLLDYDESDKFEKTFEVSLFAELFHEMLLHDFGSRILTKLQNFGRKRKLAADTTTTAAAATPAENENASKRQRTADSEPEPASAPAADPIAPLDGSSNAGETSATDAASAAATDGQMVVVEQPPDGEHPVPATAATEAEQEPKPTTDAATAKSEHAAEPARPVAPAVVTDWELLRAFEFIDRNASGQLRPEDLESLLYSLCKGLSRRTVEELVDRVIDIDSGKVHYRRLVETPVLEY